MFAYQAANNRQGLHFGLNSKTEAAKGCGWTHSALGTLSIFIDSVATTTVTTTTTTTTTHTYADAFQQTSKRVEQLKQQQEQGNKLVKALERRLTSVEKDSVETGAKTENALEKTTFSQGLILQLQSAAAANATQLQGQVDELSARVKELETTVETLVKALSTAAATQPDAAFSTDGAATCSGAKDGCEASVESQGRSNLLDAASMHPFLHVSFLWPCYCFAASLERMYMYYSIRSWCSCSCS